MADDFKKTRKTDWLYQSGKMNSRRGQMGNRDRSHRASYTIINTLVYK